MDKIILRDKKLIKIGDSWGIIIDAAYIRNGLISVDKKYQVTIE